MNDKITKQIATVQNLQKAALENAEKGSFAHSLVATSFEGHIADLLQIQNLESDIKLFEIVDFRLISPDLQKGTVPLDFISKAAESIRAMVGYTAMRLIQGGLDKKRVPQDLYSLLNLRLAGLLPGSARLIISANADRDLLDDGVAKQSLERIFSVLSSGGAGEPFLEAVNALGPGAAKRLREFLEIISIRSTETEITWTYSGKKTAFWNGTTESINRVMSALQVTEIKEQEVIILYGKIELLSKRERLDLRTHENRLVRVLYPNRLLPVVATLHLEQEVSIRVQVTEALNPLTSEASIFYELIDVLS
jgi:hypothetical protein